MKKHNKALRFFLKSIYAILLIAIMAIVATSGSLIYNFAEPEPFKGPDIFNPYRNIMQSLQPIRTIVFYESPITIIVFKASIFVHRT